MCILQENVTEVTHPNYIITMLTTSSKNTCVNVFLLRTGLKAYIKIKTGGQIGSTYEHYVWKFLNPL